MEYRFPLSLCIDLRKKYAKNRRLLGRLFLALLLSGVKILSTSIFRSSPDTVIRLLILRGSLTFCGIFRINYVIIVHI